MNWAIRNIDYDVKENIIRQARDAQMSIAEFLATYFAGKRPKAPKNNVWYIRDVDYEAKTELKRLAAIKGKSIAGVIAELLAKHNPNEVVIDSGDLKGLNDKYNELGQEIK